MVEPTSKSTTTDVALRHLYETFPYPRVLPDLDDLVTGLKAPIWSPRTSFHTYFPEQRKQDEPDDLDVLVAGCGTNLAPIMAASMPSARVVGIDISEASLGLAEEHVRTLGLDNIELHCLPIEQVRSLDRDFDFIQCTGVIHHLADPVVGMRALGSVLRQDGALMVMVYGQYGRYGIYMLQELCRTLGLSINEVDAKKAQALLAGLPDDHPFRRVHPAGGPPICLEEVTDMVLNPRDVAYTVRDVRTLVESSSLRFHRWLGHAEYLPQFSALQAAGLAPSDGSLDRWEEAAITELCHGTLLKHNFVMTHPHRAPALDLFAGDRLARAIPSLSPHLRVEHTGDTVRLTNLAHQVPVQVTAAALSLAPALQAIDDDRPVDAIADVLGARVQDARNLFRHLYLTDMIQLRLA
jgi:SAM-dependent methyltransferase